MKHLMKMFLVIYSVNATISANQFIFYLKKIPFVGKKIPDRIYSDGDLKLTATVVAAIITIIRRFAAKAVYVSLMMVLPFFLVFKEIPDADRISAFVQMFFFLSIIAGSIQISALFETNINKYICIKLMRFGARDFVITTLLARHISNFIYFMPSVLLVFTFFGGKLTHGAILVFVMTAVRFVLEAFQLMLFEKTGIVFARKYVAQWLIIIPSVVAAYLPLFFKIILPLDSFYLSFATIGILILASAAAILHIFNYKDFKMAVERSIKLDDIMVDTNKVKGEILFNGVKLKEKEFSKDSLQSHKHDDKKGYEYLNAIFFERHRKLFEKPILIRLCIIAGVLILGVILLKIFPDTQGLENGILGLMPSFVFIMYFTSLGDRVCKAMFYNCDISLLRYSFYRNKDVILRNFKVRLKKVTFMNLIVGAAMCIALFLLLAVGGVEFKIYEALLFMVSILCLAVFFSVHHLFLYYVFQPYTTELGMKNPFFRGINGIVYFACFVCLQLKHVNGFFTVGVIAATVTYIVVALTLVYRLAPKNFRVK